MIFCNNNETFTAPLPDFDVTYLQLFLLVWHNFPSPVRKELLVLCAHIIIRVADARQ